MPRTAKRPSPHRQWIVTIGGWPVAGTNAYTRALSKLKFCKGTKTPWKTFVKAGYEVAHFNLSR